MALSSAPPAPASQPPTLLDTTDPAGYSSPKITRPPGAGEMHHDATPALYLLLLRHVPGRYPADDRRPSAAGGLHLRRLRPDCHRAPRGGAAGGHTRGRARGAGRRPCRHSQALVASAHRRGLEAPTAAHVPLRNSALRQADGTLIGQRVAGSPYPALNSLSPGRVALAHGAACRREASPDPSADAAPRTAAPDLPPWPPARTRRVRPARPQAEVCPRAVEARPAVPPAPVTLLVAPPRRHTGCKTSHSLRRTARSVVSRHVRWAVRQDR